ncbi:hypothetical protein HYH03_002846 [Edaphochlamys debaryana]|uniref:Protein kinase domain-containing protein n=1 Tax=Edaphochlamys debaryana TaxID=47281 RepID=A0A835YDH7_9CHLO|nr:hypothetical protein HYH03_002846 [Edaphochlamys debaryana]|eukprot:KAG2499268.1 hypothetical protein HYH03_002846 [Edaphochlamys debaryana]
MAAVCSLHIWRLANFPVAARSPRAFRAALQLMLLLLLLALSPISVAAAGAGSEAAASGIPESAPSAEALQVHTADELIELLKTHAPPLVISIAADLTFNATNWPDPLAWPPAAATADPSADGSPPAATNLTLVLTGVPLRTADGDGDSNRNASATNATADDANSTQPSAPSNSSSNGNGTGSGSGIGGAAGGGQGSWRRPRVDLANMQGRLQLAQGAVLVLRDLEITGTTLGTAVDHQALEFVSESRGAALLLQRCALHNTICPAPGELASGYRQLSRAATSPAAVAVAGTDAVPDQDVMALPGGVWCEPGATDAARAAAIAAAAAGSNATAVSGTSAARNASGGGGGAAAAPEPRCYSPVLQLDDVAYSRPDFGQVGGYTTLLQNTTLLCDASVAPNCTQDKSARECFLALLANAPRGITAPLVLQSAALAAGRAAGADAGGGGSRSVGAGAGGGPRQDGRGRAVAAAVGGTAGGVGVLLLAAAFAAWRYRRKGGRFAVWSGLAAPEAGDDIESPTGKSSSATKDATALTASASAPAPAPAFGCGTVDQLLEKQRHAHAPTDIRLSVLLGAGSFGRVYSGMWRGRPVAVKILTHSPAEAAVVEREAEQVSLACRHPNVVRTLHAVRLDVTGAAARLQHAQGRQQSGGTGASEDMFPTARVPGTDGNYRAASVYETWLVQELCDGGALSSALYGGRFTCDGRPDLPIILALALDICRGMAYLHERGIVHGDLKAENVLLRARSSGNTGPHDDEDGAESEAETLTSASGQSSSGPDQVQGGPGPTAPFRAKVADLGLSRALEPGATHQTTRNVGTLTHMPPEALHGGQLRKETDVFAYGILLWELYTGCRPYSGLTAGEVVHRVVVEGARPAFPRSTPQAWRELAAECWAQRAEERPSFEKVEQDLLEMAAALAPPPPPLQQQQLQPQFVVSRPGARPGPWAPQPPQPQAAGPTSGLVGPGAGAGAAAVTVQGWGSP